MEGIWVWKGHGYEGDKGMERTWVWKGYDYGEDMGMEGI